LSARPPRQLLVGIELPSGARLPKENHLIIAAGEIAGRVTSIARSPTLDRAIGLALLTPDLAQGTGEISIRGDDGEMIAAKIVKTPFYDAQNLRQKAPVSA
jgi:sarcosine oxidase subunit alpha